ncbi:MAG: replicative DNA helicase [Candidatus Caldatribacteriota bacterium]
MSKNMDVKPKKIEVEQALLGAVFLNADNAFIGIEHLRVKDFYKTCHQLLFSTIKALLKEGKNIDLITVQDYLQKNNKIEEVGGISYITYLIESVPVTYKVIDYCNILRRTTYEREVYCLAEQFKDGKISFNELSSKILAIPSLQKGADESTLRDLFLATLQRSSEGVAHKFLIPSLNKYLGGVDLGETIVIGGYTSQGKTMMGLQLAMDFAEQNLVVLYCTSEMTEIETARRILSNMTETNIMDFRKGNLDDATKEKIEQAGKELGDCWKIIIRSVFYTSDIRHLINKYNPDIIFVDHLQNLGRHEPLTEYQRVTHNMKDLQAMALENQKVMFVLSQLKRRKEDGTSAAPKLSDLRDSGAIEEKSNIVLFVYWKKRLQDEVRPRQGGEPPETMQIIIGKNRDGVIGRIKLDFYPEYCKICSPPNYIESDLLEENELHETSNNGKQRHRYNQKQISWKK